jgi:type II secretory pathway component GspD/PulD (secretin)
MILLCGCRSTSTNGPASDTPNRRTFVLHKIPREQAQEALSGLQILSGVSHTDPHVLLVNGPASHLDIVAAVIDLIDTDEPFIAEALWPASMVRALPSNSQIAQALGGISIGTFAHPPEIGSNPRAIIDVLGDSVVAIAPARLWPYIRAVVTWGAQEQRTGLLWGEPDSAGGTAGPVASDLSKAVEGQPIVQMSEFGQPAPASGSGPAAPIAETSELKASPREPPTEFSTSTASRAVVPLDTPMQQTASRGVLRPAAQAEKPVSATQRVEPSFPNGDDILELTLPEKIELTQLLDLAGQYLGLDCVYEADKIGNQMITLKLHSKMRSEMRVKDLYSLLQTVLKFKGLAMTRLDGNLVSIVPAAEAMEIDPQLVDPNSGVIQAGDIVVTRIFELQYVDVAGVTNLLQNMKLSVAVSPIPETQTLFVTCYAHRMARIEQLVEMVDRPGRPREFRFRQLQHTAAGAITQKILALAGELEGIAIRVGSTNTGSQPPRNAQPGGQQTVRSTSTAVYLDTDDRTNRILMIGPWEQLQSVEGLIDTLDVPRQDLRTIHVYEVRRAAAQGTLEKLRQLGLIDKAAQAAKAGKTPAPSPSVAESALEEEPQVVLLEATNSLLVNATATQHAQIRMVLAHIDVAPQDQRTMRIYPIRHVDADDVARKLQQFTAFSQPAASPGGTGRISPAGSPQATPAAMITGADSLLPDAPQMMVLEVTNSLLIHATADQHERIEAVVQYIDMEAPKQVVPYEIYFLENQDPEQLSQVLGKLIQETVLNADGKVEKTIAKTNDQITIIPDKSTFSLIVHASRKNQDWIASLVEKLDKRRPQVLIDVTLVEITETDAFNYDLNVITSVPDLTHTSGLTGTVVPGTTSTDIMNRLAASDRSQFADLQSNDGELNAFYGDKHINLLLHAMQTKNYGRILAKPKILVNDNEPGTIKTADTTYVAKRSSIPVGSGGAGNDVTLIETAVTYEPYEAGITLNITPHISQGDLLRMEIELSRSDFRKTEDSQKPPDQTTSELKTTAFVPDASTIILGGLLRLNQNKGGTKVPILGDIPLLGGLFRTINNRDQQSKLYIFVKAEIIRPAGGRPQELRQLEAISERNRKAFEEHERQFQGYQSWPGVKSRPVDPPKVLEAR